MGENSKLRNGEPWKLLQTVIIRHIGCRCCSSQPDVPSVQAQDPPHGVHGLVSTEVHQLVAILLFCPLANARSWMGAR